MSPTPAGSRGDGPRPEPAGPAPDGLLVVDKPSGWTSHDVVGRTRRLARTRKVGHAGTLDPLATGVLLLGIGRATRLLGHLALADKDYLATIRLGAATVTDDSEGEVLEVRDASGVTDAALEAAVAAFRGTIDQVPSSVSAIKVDGVRSYARVRSGEAVVLAARHVTVSRFEVLSRRGDDVAVAVTCTSGTYIRALARDLGALLDVGGHLTALRRTRVGPFDLSHARELGQLSETDGSTGHEARLSHEPDAAGLPPREPGTSNVFDRAVLPLDDAVAAAFPRRELGADEAVDLSHGKRLTATGRAGTIGAFGPDGRCVALIEDRDDAARASVVFRPAGSS